MVLKLLEGKEELDEELPASTIFRMNLSAMMVLLGGFIIRLAVIYAGQLSRLT